jgi:hypothetical protein
LFLERTINSTIIIINHILLAGMQLPHCHCILLPAVDTCACRGAPPAPCQTKRQSAIAAEAEQQEPAVNVVLLRHDGE